MELTLFVDHQCNLRCSYCYTGDKSKRPMSVGTMRDAVRLIAGMPMPHLDVSFFGGEPLLRKELVRETVEFVERTLAELPEPRPSLRFIMNTNATLIDDEAIALMSRPRRFTVFASIDGPRELHDRYRVNVAGKGSYDATLRGVEALRRARIPFQLMLVFGTDTAARLGDALSAVLPLGAEKIQLNANYRDDWTDASIAALRSGLEQAKGVWMRHFRAGSALAVEPLHTKILSHLKSGAPCPSRCLLGGREVTVAPSGRLYPCPQMVGEDVDVELCIGHVETGFDRERLAELQAQKDRVGATCASCEIQDRCLSQCGCRHVALTGRLGEITATLCEIESAYIDVADQLAAELFEERCPAFLDFYYRRAWTPAAGAELIRLRRKA